MIIRKAIQADYDQIWDIFSSVIQRGDTYVFPPDTPKADLGKHWLAEYMTTFVAEEEGRTSGTYVIKPNQPGLGSHIANCSYMVSPNAQGKGIGKIMCEHSIAWARQSGYIGIQFNIIVSTNVVAVGLWKKYGFEIIGTTPKGFRHPQLVFVDTYVMYRSL
ncbi:MAG: GNAT family N-acetyltransferase [Mameliella sp.]|nr:GNAT family N-acetyltransferase [Phaeodactylibacter sp.]